MSTSSHMRTDVEDIQSHELTSNPEKKQKNRSKYQPYTRWTVDELDKLKYVMDITSDTDKPNWNVVASFVFTKTALQCRRKIASMKMNRFSGCALSFEEHEALMHFGVKYCIDKYPYRTEKAWRRWNMKINTTL